MKRIILGTIMLLSIPALANSVAIANFAVERYADYTYPSVERWMPKTYWISASDFASYCKKRILDPILIDPILYNDCVSPSPDGWTFVLNENGEREGCCGTWHLLEAKEKAKEAGMYERIYSADTANIFRDSAFILLSIGGIVLIVSSKRKQKIKG